MPLDGSKLIGQVVADILANVSVTSAKYAESLARRAGMTIAEAPTPSFDIRFRSVAARGMYYHVAGSPSDPGGSSRLVIGLVYPIDGGVPAAACTPDGKVVAALRNAGWRATPFPDFYGQIDIAQYDRSARHLLFRADGATVAIDTTAARCITSLTVISFGRD